MHECIVACALNTGLALLPDVYTFSKLQVDGAYNGCVHLVRFVCALICARVYMMWVHIQSYLLVNKNQVVMTF